MLDDMVGEVRWPAALVMCVAAMVWAFNAHADRENRQEERQTLVEACSEQANIDQCVVEIRESLDD